MKRLKDALIAFAAIEGLMTLIGVVIALISLLHSWR